MADGVIGISDRLCIVSAYSTESSERYIHAHLYNRYQEERYSTYERYYSPTSEKTALVERELIFTERQSTCERWYSELSSRSSIVSGFVSENNERYSTYERWYVEGSERISHFGFTTYSERNGYWFSKWNSYRYGYAKSWHVTERFGTTLGKLFSRVADQRYAHIQLFPSLTSVRNAYTEAHHFKLKLTIEPTYSSLLENTEISPLYQPLFENEKVVEYDINVNSVKVLDDSKTGDLGFVYWDKSLGKWSEDIGIGRYGIVRIPLFRYGETNSWFSDGFFIPTDDLFYIALIPKCTKFSLDFPAYDKDDCWQSVINEAFEHGYIKGVLFGRQYTWGRKLTFTQLKYKPLSFKLYIADYFIPTNYFNIMLIYGYPTTRLVNKTILQFYKEL